MKRIIVNQAWVLIALVAVWSCGPKEDPQPALPDYLRIPVKLEGYTGSGRVSTSGALSLLAEGPEQLDKKTNTYSGVLGVIGLNDNLTIQFTVGQPLPFKDTGSVPDEYQASGTLSIVRTISPGTYPLSSKAPTPRGEFADLVINMPGPQIYGNTGGTLTISESTLIKTQERYSLYRIVGSFDATLYATGVGITNRNPTLTGTFDVLVVKYTG